jgi:hypothetical protein
MENINRPSSGILYHYKNVPVRRHNIVIIRVDEITYKEIIDIEKETGLSQRKIIGYSATPCKCCENSSVRVFVNDKEVSVKRGILSKRIPVSFTQKKINHNNNRPVINVVTGEIYPSAKSILPFVDISYNPLLDRLNDRVPNNTPFKFLDEHAKSAGDCKEDQK